jgi:hypothetical protein
VFHSKLATKLIFYHVDTLVKLKTWYMRTIGIVILIAFFAACNNAGNSTKQTDSSAAKDNTNMYDTGVGSSMTDTAQRLDTSLIPNKMQDTGIKK